MSNALGNFVIGLAAATLEDANRKIERLAKERDDARRERDELRARLASNTATAAPGDLPPLPEKVVIDRHIETGIVIRGHTDDAMHEYGRACIASNAGAAIPGELDEAAAYRLWRDCELAEDCWFMEHIAEYLPNTQRAPTAAEWDAAMLRVMQDRAATPSNPPAGATQEQTK